jgi:hypothetical protein
MSEKLSWSLSVYVLLNFLEKKSGQIVKQVRSLSNASVAYYIFCHYYFLSSYGLLSQSLNRQYSLLSIRSLFFSIENLLCGVSFLEHLN